MFPNDERHLYNYNEEFEQEAQQKLIKQMKVIEYQIEMQLKNFVDDDGNLTTVSQDTKRQRYTDLVEQLGRDIELLEKQTYDTFFSYLNALNEFNNGFTDFSDESFFKAKIDVKELNLFSREEMLTETFSEYSQEFKADVRHTLITSMVKGENEKTFAKDMQQVLNTHAYKISRIYRTETARLTNQSKFENLINIENDGRLGTTVKKRWVATLDARTRDTHKELDGKIVDVDEPFIYGLLAPAVGSAPADEIINCRCIFQNVYNFEDEELGEYYNTPRNRAVRNPQTGKTERIPYVTYAEWKVNGGNEKNATLSTRLTNATNLYEASRGLAEYGIGLFFADESEKLSESEANEFTETLQELEPYIYVFNDYVDIEHLIYDENGVNKISYDETYTIDEIGIKVEGGTIQFNDAEKLLDLYLESIVDFYFTYWETTFNIAEHDKESVEGILAKRSAIEYLKLTDKPITDKNIAKYQKQIEAFDLKKLIVEYREKGEDLGKLKKIYYENVFYGSNTSSDFWGVEEFRQLT